MLIYSLIDLTHSTTAFGTLYTIPHAYTSYDTHDSPFTEHYVCNCELYPTLPFPVQLLVGSALKVPIRFLV